MTLDTWERLGPGRYATQLNGHSLQIIRNPDYADSRRYIAVVDRVPLPEPLAGLSQAKTKAIKHAFGLTGRGKKRNGAAWSPSHIKPAPEPAPEPAIFDPLGLDYAQFEEVPPEPPAMAEPEVLQLPPPELEPEPAPAQACLQIALSGITLTDDQASSLAAIKAAIDLLREVPGAGEVKCRVYLPHPWIDL